MPVNLCESFIEERQYLKNVSAKTIEWYQNAFRVFSGCGLEEPDSQILTRLKTRVVKLAKEGHKDISINTYTRVINAYLRWSHQEGLSVDKSR